MPDQVDPSDHRQEVRTFLASRRARLSPERAGVPLYGGRRRVKGLRREEVAQLAGVSTDYYARLERGNLAGVSEAVLDAVARALQLDEAEHGHLSDLARTANASAGSAHRARRRPSRTRGQPAVRPGVLRVVESITEAAAMVVNGRRDVLAANALARAVFCELYASPERPVNTARFTFLDPRAHDFFADWERAADDTVAGLRTDAGRNPYDRALTDLVGELATRSEEFRTRWASHDVRHHRTGTKQLRHPAVGDLELYYEVLPLPADADQALVVYTADRDTPACEGLRLLASWAATEKAQRAVVDDRERLGLASER
jgi:transcriptional regulator with XRE-family HTH domain